MEDSMSKELLAYKETILKQVKTESLKPIVSTLLDNQYKFLKKEPSLLGDDPVITQKLYADHIVELYNNAIFPNFFGVQVVDKPGSATVYGLYIGHDQTPRNLYIYDEKNNSWYLDNINVLDFNQTILTAKEYCELYTPTNIMQVTSSATLLNTYKFKKDEPQPNQFDLTLFKWLLDELEYYTLIMPTKETIDKDMIVYIQKNDEQSLGEMNRMLVSQKVLNVITTSEKYQHCPGSCNSMFSRVGTWDNKVELYLTNECTDDFMLLGHKGVGEVSSGAIFVPYITRIEREKSVVSRFAIVDNNVKSNFTYVIFK